MKSLFLIVLVLIVTVFFIVQEAVIFVQIHLGYEWNMGIIVVWAALIAWWVWWEVRAL